MRYRTETLLLILCRRLTILMHVSMLWQKSMADGSSRLQKAPMTTSTYFSTRESAAPIAEKQHFGRQAGKISSMGRRQHCADPRRLSQHQPG